jgi:predicted nuclease with TOPRIM domain
MASNNELELLRLMNTAIKGITELRVSNEDLKEGQLRIENRLGNVENRLEKVETEVKVMSKKLTQSIDGVSELRARIEILEEKMLSVN